MLVDVLHSFLRRQMSLREREFAFFFHDLVALQFNCFFLKAPFIGAYFLPINIAWRCHGRGV